MQLRGRPLNLLIPSPCYELSCLLMPMMVKKDPDPVGKNSLYKQENTVVNSHFSLAATLTMCFPFDIRQ